MAEFGEKSSKTHTANDTTTTTMLASKAPPIPPKIKQKHPFSTMRKKHHHSRRSASFSCCSDDANHHSRRQSRRTVVFTAVTACTLSKTKTVNEDDKGAAWAYEDEKTVPAHQTEDMPPVKYKEYVDYDRGFSMKVPEDWLMDTPNGVLEREFHPRAEYGGRRCTVIVNPVGKVESKSDGGNGIPKLRDLEMEEYTSAEKLGKTRANDFAPLEGATGGAKAATFLVKAEEKEDGSLYFYEWRSQAMLNFHFWEVAVLGPGMRGSGRKLGRRDVVSVKCQMPEDGMTPGDVEIFETITQSLKLLPLEEVTVDDEF